MQILLRWHPTLGCWGITSSNQHTAHHGEGLHTVHTEQDLHLGELSVICLPLSPFIGGRGSPLDLDAGENSNTVKQQAGRWHTPSGETGGERAAGFDCLI